jgi:ketosteroid isomerase-like protein
MIRLITTRYLALIALLLAWTPARSVAQEAAPSDPAAAAITAVLSSQQSAWNKGDIRSFMDGYWNSPDTTFSSSTGLSRGWQSVYNRYRQRYSSQAAMGRLDFSQLEIRSLGPGSALVLGNWHLSLATGDLGGVFSLVFQKFPEGWKIVHDHTSLVTPAQP